MGLIVLIAAAAAGAFLLAGIEPTLAWPIVSATSALLMLAALAARGSRATLVALTPLHAPALLLFAVLLGALGYCASMLPEQFAWRGRSAVLNLFSLALAAGATAAIAGAYGRTKAVTALLIAAIGAALVILAGSTFDAASALGRLPPELNSQALGGAYGLVAMLSVFAASDELRRRPGANGAALPPLARRMFAPMAGLITSFSMLLLGGSTAALAAAAIAGLAFAGALALRARRSRVGLALVPAVAAVSVVAAALAAFAAGVGGGLGWITAGAQAQDSFSASAVLNTWAERPFVGHGLGSLSLVSGLTAPTGFRWLAETGYVGIGLAATCLLALLAGLIALKDRGRPISRGFILFAGLATFALIEAVLTYAFDHPAPALMLALMVGFAASYLDFAGLRRVRTTASA